MPTGKEFLGSRTPRKLDFHALKYRTAHLFNFDFGNPEQKQRRAGTKFARTRICAPLCIH
jgi:hypothetical protein